MADRQADRISYTVELPAKPPPAQARSLMRCGNAAIAGRLAVGRTLAAIAFLQ